MQLEYSFKNTNILNEKTVFLIELPNRFSAYYQILLEQYVVTSNLSDYICVFENREKKKVLVAMINEYIEWEAYFNVLSMHFYMIFQSFGRRINVYLPSVVNFVDLALAAMKFCEKSMGYNYIFQFFCEQQNIEILSQAFECLRNLKEERKRETSEFLYKTFSCFYCKIFTLEPLMVSCCSLVVCKNCSRSKHRCPKCNHGTEIENLTIFQRLFVNAPYYCFCGEKMHFSDRKEHSKVCEVPWYKCKFCNCSLSYKNSISHFKDHHIVNLMNDSFF